MFSHILIPVALDHEGAAARKIATARHLLAPGGRITLLTVLEDIPGFVAEFVTVREANHLTNKVREKLAAIAAEHGDVESDVVRGKAGVQICAYAAEKGVDLIVVSAQSPDARGYALGSTAARAARRAPCSVFILR
ncbi:Universal stress protein family protein [Pseudoruegeria aquimaris]|uniref:Universal stress protein family protein n=1 Tax=Pseudoruegeria aquimaris TaxID=393663 RepID=A0A1Y5TGA0_9RHOB|nr:universal stress protein [Pseudoruegeria aquimaris]SLN59715.1 Universal stress protein family protein [Pseudoruegeria aquimaris]